MRKLTTDELRTLTRGAATVTDIAEGGGRRYTRFFRFTREEMDLYRGVSTDFYRKTFATSGVRLCFTTNSTCFHMAGDILCGSSRRFWKADVIVNGKYLTSFGAKDIPDLSEFSETVALGEGEKTVTVVFPWSVCLRLLDFSLDDEAAFAPVAADRKFLFFGDSITHGYDAQYPSHTYTAILTDLFNADAYDLGIGGEIFRRELPACAFPVEDPDAIFVAYGTNDWAQPHDKFVKQMTRFFEKLTAKAPAAKIFALLPVWRGDELDEQKVAARGVFAEHVACIAEEVKKYPNVTVVDCHDFIPHDPANYSPDVLHPNDEGFARYAAGVYQAVKDVL